MSAEILSARGLSVGYDGRPTLEGLDFSCAAGQTLCLIGPNGAGKSTILRTLSGLLPPVAGQVLLHGTPIASVDRAKRARMMAVVLTERLQPGMMTAYAIAAMGRTPYTGFTGRLNAQDHRVVEDCMAMVGALDVRDRLFTQLSDGEKQKVLIARALAQQPQLIVLDEPTSHLDIRHRLEVMSILNRLCRERGLAVVLALHDIDLAIKGCQSVMLVGPDGVEAHGPPSDVVGAGTIDHLYGIRDAVYDEVLGSVEMHQGLAPRAFVVAGAGTGTRLYRALGQMGVGAATGILHENDVDLRVARGMGIPVVAERAFYEIGAAARAEADALAAAVDCLIDAGFPVGPCNRANVDLLAAAAHRGARVFSLRTEDAVRALYGRAPVRAATGMAQLRADVQRALEENNHK